MKSRFILTGAIIAVSLVGGIIAVKKHRPAIAGQQAPSPAQLELKMRGEASAPVEIQEFSDFQCPACRNSQPALDQLLKEYQGKIKLIFYHFPLQGHKWAGLAHQAAECANEAGKFWQYHDRLYAEQPAWSIALNASEIFLSYARDLNLDLDKFAACLSDPKATQRILADRSKGQYIQVSSTPTILINGERLVGPVEIQTKGADLVRKHLGLPPLPKPVVPATPVAPPAVPDVKVVPAQVPATVPAVAPAVPAPTPAANQSSTTTEAPAPSPAAS